MNSSTMRGLSWRFHIEASLDKSNSGQRWESRLNPCCEAIALSLCRWPEETGHYLS
jgi:hypothetical protein